MLVKLDCSIVSFFHVLTAVRDCWFCQLLTWFPGCVDVKLMYMLMQNFSRLLCNLFYSVNVQVR
jgi:hypothetical protein